MVESKFFLLTHLGQTEFIQALNNENHRLLRLAVFSILIGNGKTIHVSNKFYSPSLKMIHENISS